MIPGTRGKWARKRGDGGRSKGALRGCFRPRRRLYVPHRTEASPRCSQLPTFGPMAFATWFDSSWLRGRPETGLGMRILHHQPQWFSITSSPPRVLFPRVPPSQVLFPRVLFPRVLLLHKFFVMRINARAERCFLPKLTFLKFHPLILHLTANT